MTTFTREQLRCVVSDRATVIHDGGSFSINVQDLAAFALSLWKRAENAEARCDSLSVDLDAERGACNDAEAERDEARRELAAWKEKSDRHETERDSFRLEADRLREKGAWLQAEVDVLRGKACDEEQAEGNGPCGVCRNCAWAERDRLKVELGEAEEAIRDLTDSGDAMRFSMPTAAMAGKAGWDASRRHAAVRRALERGK